ncbi:MAG: prepilin peptidase [Anaerolineaceae bacterium]|nr:prepilin peptidase [Anaerolineaceae bacterium]
MSGIIDSLKFQGDMTLPRVIGGAVIIVLLIIASVEDTKTRKIPAYCSYPIMLIAMALFAFDREYLLIPFFILAVLSTGSFLLRVLMIIASVILIANKGEWLIPLIFGFVIGDIFFATGLIGGGDAQLLFGMIAYAYRGWGLLIITAACTMITGVIFIARNGKGNPGRFRELMVNLGKGTVSTDESRIRLPFAVVLCLSFVIYGAINFL